LVLLLKTVQFDYPGVELLAEAVVPPEPTGVAMF